MGSGSRAELHVTIRPGDGPAILLLHGLTGSSASWTSVMDCLAPARCVAPDLLGFGKSPKPRNNTYDLASHCDLLEPIIARERPVVVAGHSMGAILALEVLRRHPETEAGVLVSPAVFASADEARRSMKDAPAMHRLTLGSPVAARVMCAVSCRLRPILQAVAPIFARGFPADVARASLDHTWQSYSRSMANVVTAGLAPGLMEQVGQRVDIVHGRDDTTVPAALVEPLARLARSFALIDGGHEALLSHPEAVASAIASAWHDSCPT